MTSEQQERQLDEVVLLCRDDPSKVLAVLDWELSTLGKSCIGVTNISRSAKYQR